MSSLLAASPADYTIEPRPAWTEVVERGTPQASMHGQVSNGAHYLLLDTQVRSTDDDRVTWRRTAIQALNAEGVHTVANLEIGFDPSFQALRLHAIDVVRDGRVIDRLASAKVRILQREAELERRIYDGRKTASILLEDMRAGDIVDYAYSLHGRHPVFEGQEFGSFGLQFNVPVSRIHARLLAQDDVQFVTRNTPIEVEAAAHAGLRSWTWRIDHATARVTERDAPAWHDPYAGVQWSSYADWGEVARWALPLYALPEARDDALQAEVERIAAAESTAAARLLAVLRFAQREIRYLGIGIGAGSYRPYPPALVLERRFGDCKDKTLLMLAMLDRLGIEARAALVATDIRRGIRERLPSPGLFDHVVVQARIDGQTYWLDPTRAVQNADLANLVQADFDDALVVDARTHALVSMKPATPPLSSRDVHTTFDAAAGFEKPVNYTVVTSVRGARAESLRGTLATSSLGELQKGYLNYYAGYYPGIALLSPLRIEDDEAANRITTTERYAITGFMSREEGAQRHVVTISTPDIDDLLRAPASAVRDSPLWLVHPFDVTVTTETLLPSAWKIEPERITVDDPAFSYERTIAITAGDRLVIRDRYQSRLDEVSAADTMRYASSLARAREWTAYELNWPVASTTDGEGSSPLNWPLLLIALMATAGWAWLALVGYRYDPPPFGIAAPGAPVGIAGWLVLPAIGVVISPIVQITTSWKEIDTWSVANWNALTVAGGESHHALWAPILLYTLVVEVGMIVFSLLLVAVFFQRRTSVPQLYIAFLCATVLVSAVDIGLVGLIPGLTIETTQVAAVVRSGLAAALWIAYFLKSGRVKATFVRRRRQPLPVEPEVPTSVPLPIAP